MLVSRIDVHALRSDIRALVAECIRGKRLLRTTWTRPMAEDQRLLLWTQRRLTERLVLLAASRHRTHLRDPDANLATALRVAPGYAIATMGAAE